ncbi:MAG: hypothetical protein IMF11_10315 [Proteobacteria bacterium]|nr:hypothetical protein [Pseudomonadota bacterium]
MDLQEDILCFLRRSQTDRIHTHDKNLSLRIGRWEMIADGSLKAHSSRLKEMNNLRFVNSSLGLKTSCFVFLFIGTLLVCSNVYLALTPDQVVVVANKMAWHSCKLAKYYMEKRRIPESKLIKLKAPTGEHCSRDDYDKWATNLKRDNS